MKKKFEKEELVTNTLPQPNATKVMASLNLLPQLHAAGLTPRPGYDLLRWQDGSIISQRPPQGWNEEMFGQAS